MCLYLGVMADSHGRRLCRAPGQPPWDFIDKPRAAPYHSFEHMNNINAVPPSRVPPARFDANPPRHQSVAQTLASEIEKGVYPVGSKLPRELDLCEQFGASRHTIRVALERLVQWGLITRTPRLGTVVKASRPQRDYRLKVANITDLNVFGARTTMRILDRAIVPVKAGSEEALDDYVGQHWLWIKGLRHSEDHAAPISYHEVWVHPDYRAVAGVEGVIARSIVVLIDEQFGVTATRVRQTINSAGATPEVEGLLQVDAGTPCLWVRRAYYRENGQLIELALSVHPGSSFTYEMELEHGPAR